MAGATLSRTTVRGTASLQKKLPLCELKILFFKFLDQQGYALPLEVDSILENAISNNNIGSRGQSPCPSICNSVPSKPARAAKTVASNKEAIVSGISKSIHVVGSKPSPPPKFKFPPPSV
ncbi:hypothetical protein EVAR_20026_1 [Eumeta japonica]|uniref:Uncharacterized protein n=1 Tax=Eumeta variegata TaxID=151549 RepID=A0A4C1VA16_EUMVA|nr:hypothetical protein EVAR_20026_1 [Eumeta japonica]